MQAEVHIVNAFTAEGQGGNPAGVMLDADHLNSAQKQQIAASAGMSETAFVSQSGMADFKLEFFTPFRQIAHCGHATIATFAFLQQQGILKDKAVTSKETIDGVRQIRLEGPEVFMEQRAPVFSHIAPKDYMQVIQAAGIQEDQLIYSGICNTGNGFLLLELKDIHALQYMQPDRAMIRILSDRYDLIGFYAFVRSPATGIDATARMFAPAYGIEEESATGMAAGPLACYLHTQSRHRPHFIIEQGRYMQPASPSRISVQLALNGEEIISLIAGGHAARNGSVMVAL